MQSCSYVFSKELIVPGLFNYLYPHRYASVLGAFSRRSYPKNCGRVSLDWCDFLREAPLGFLRRLIYKLALYSLVWLGGPSVYLKTCLL